MGPDARHCLKRVLIRAALVAAPLLLLAGLGTSRLGRWLVVEDPLQKSDAIVVLGGTMYERPLEAIDLYNAGWAPRIYLVGEVADWGEAELARRGVDYLQIIDLQIATLVKLGVPRDAIRAINPSGSTAEEALNVRRLVAQERFSRIIVVTSLQHTRRARLVMNRRIRDAGAEVVIRASRYDRSNVRQWWQDRSTLRFTLFETQRLLAYWIGAVD